MIGSGYISVLTGDLIGYTQNVEDSENYLKNLELALNLASKLYNFNYQIFRGDSFQGILQNPGKSLEVALLIKTFLIAQSYSTSDNLVQSLEPPMGEKNGSVPTSGAKKHYDARIAIGIGTVDFYDLNSIGQSDGAAFRMSGHRLDEMKTRKQNLSIVTPEDDYNNELDVECAFIDAIIAKWTREQSLSVFYSLQGMNQYQIAKKLNRAQSGVSQRLSKAGYWAISKMIARFNEKLNQN